VVPKGLSSPTWPRTELAYERESTLVHSPRTNGFFFSPAPGSRVRSPDGVLLPLQGYILSTYLPN